MFTRTESVGFITWNKSFDYCNLNSQATLSGFSISSIHNPTCHTSPAADERFVVLWDVAFQSSCCFELRLTLCFSPSMMPPAGVLNDQTWRCVQWMHWGFCSPVQLGLDSVYLTSSLGLNKLSHNVNLNWVSDGFWSLIIPIALQELLKCRN